MIRHLVHRLWRWPHRDQDSTRGRFRETRSADGSRHCSHATMLFMNGVDWRAGVVSCFREARSTDGSRHCKWTLADVSRLGVCAGFFWLPTRPIWWFQTSKLSLGQGWMKKPPIELKKWPGALCVTVSHCQCVRIKKH